MRRADTPECPIYGLSALTAYHHKKCRCDVCRAAERAQQRRSYAKNKDKILERHRRYRADNLAKCRAQERLSRLRCTLRQYGVDMDWYDEHSANGCEICGAKENGRSNGRRLLIDHDHGTGAARGVLCHGCNVSVGHFGDDPDHLRRAAKYLERRGGVA